VALVVYAVFTRKIWRAADEQAEALQKPCVTLATARRNDDEATLSDDEGSREVGIFKPDGWVAVRNIGSGPALNVHWYFEPVNPPPGQNVPTQDGEIPHLSREISRVRRMQIPMHGSEVKFRNYYFRATYESLSGALYETRIRLQEGVLNRISFRSVGHAARANLRGNL